MQSSFGAHDRRRSSINNGQMSSDEISVYLDAIDEPKRATLQNLRETIAEIIPEAEQGLSYHLPTFRSISDFVEGDPSTSFRRGTTSPQIETFNSPCERSDRQLE